MRPHTRTHCNKKGGECDHEQDASHATAGGSGGKYSGSGSPRCGRSGAAGLLHDHHVAALHQHGVLVGGAVHGGSITGGAGSSTSGGPASAMDSASGVDDASGGILRHYTSLVELPAELLVKILEFIPFKEHSNIRLVCRRLNEIAAGRLNSTFHQLQNKMLMRFQHIKAQMPRRESARRNHPLARECDIVETLHMRLTLLQMTFGKHIERKHICFFPGEILDEVYRILRYIQSTHPPLGRTYKVTDELFDLSTMAMEYFKENIEPSLPDITYIGSDFLDFTPPFASPLKKISRTGGLDSPISSRASAVGSSCSEPPISYSQFGMEDEEEEKIGEGLVIAPQSNMVLRKRIKRIRAGMKKYNTQLDEVKRELKSCKSKMDGQTKQVAEYTSRLDEYDKKLEENSRKFGTVLAELNKCKTELQFYRSRAHLHQCQNCGSSLTDQASDTPATSEQTDNHQVGFPNIAGVDKQAMVEDWLNPDTQGAGYRTPAAGYKKCPPGLHDTREESEPQVQLNNTNIQKNFKAEDEGYLKSPGCCTRTQTGGAPKATPPSPRSGGHGGSAGALGGLAAAPGSSGAMLAPSGGEIAADGCPSPANAGPSGVRKRKSRDEEDKKVCLRGHILVKGTRTKRPKLAGPS